jgi:hypothetical protein
VRLDGVGGEAGADDDMASFAWRGAWRGAVAVGDRPLHTPTVKKNKATIHRWYTFFFLVPFQGVGTKSNDS